MSEVLGTARDVTVTFTNAQDAAYDPATVELHYEAPDGTVTSVPAGDPAIIRDGEGVYRSTILLDQAGTWFYRWEADGDVASEGEVHVAASSIGGGVTRDARRELERMVAADTYPTLSGGDLDALLVLAKRPDSEDREPSDPAWVPTWDLRTAAAEGWEWKANRASGDFDFAADGQRFDRSQIVKHCQDRARYYRRRSAASSITLVTPYSPTVTGDVVL